MRNVCYGLTFRVRMYAILLQVYNLVDINPTIIQKKNIKMNNILSLYGINLTNR